ncbi:3-oxo-tetronate kinase [Nakamurella endophytica]|uniref:3-oxo-tetronate kinase n=1 Tax=Nakamurella endophytica TaxID=1748367 RepID=UPI00166BB7DD|nr:3-oxo-tetronate kinase [Nakamurella endophytica]
MLDLGCIADDVTGATDVATALVGAGFRTEVRFGVPAGGADVPGDVDATVVALKSRTAPVDDAVRQSRAALAWLRAAGAGRFYVKYCSTFDSTPRGNIGPVVDALLADLDAPVTVVVPAFPAGGRTVYRGHLFVFDQLLADSSMRHHPLTPMTESSVVRLLAPQTRHRVGLVPLTTVHRGAAAVRDLLQGAAARTLFVVDVVEDGDLATIAAAIDDLPLVTGGSGLAAALRPRTPRSSDGIRCLDVVPGRRAVLVGSLSDTTGRQLRHARERLPVVDLEPSAVTGDVRGWAFAAAERAAAWWRESPDRPVLFSSVDVGDLSADVVEAAFGQLAVALRARGARQFVLAGGETSGAVVAALGVSRLSIGPELAPGVAWGTADSVAGPLDLVLKSGNFGGDDLFTAAWHMLDRSSGEQCLGTTDVVRGRA